MGHSTQQYLLASLLSIGVNYRRAVRENTIRVGYKPSDYVVAQSYEP